MTTTPETPAAPPVELPVAPTVAGPLVAALERLWAEIQRRHPDVPDVVVTLASGTAGNRPGAVTLGHFAGSRWVTTGEAGRRSVAELFIGGEGLALGAVNVLGTLLHEAAHGVAHTRKIQDTSRQGRYHNARFKALGEELGLVITQVEPIGWSDTTVPAATSAAYADELEQLAAVITAHRRSEHTRRTLAPAGTPEADTTGIDADAAADEDQDDADTGDRPGQGRTSNNNGESVRCGCPTPRRVRVAPSVLALGPILCGLCGTEFTTPEAD